MHMCKSGGIYWSEKLCHSMTFASLNEIAGFLLLMSITCNVCRMKTNDITNNNEPYNLRRIEEIQIMNFFLVTSSHFLKRLCSVMNSMLLNRWIDHDDSFWTSLTCFYVLLLSIFFYRRRASSFSSRCSCFFYCSYSFLCARHRAFERVVQNEEFNLKRKKNFFSVHVEVHFASFLISFSLFLITLLISLHSWVYSVIGEMHTEIIRNGL